MKKRTLIPRAYASAREYLMDVINSPAGSEREKVRIALELLRGEDGSTARRSRLGKKQQVAEAARAAGIGRFATPPPPPKLVVDNSPPPRPKKPGS